MKYKIDCLIHEVKHMGENVYYVESIDVETIRTFYIETPDDRLYDFTDIVVDAIRADNDNGYEFIRSINGCDEFVVYVINNSGDVFRRYCVKRMEKIEEINLSERTM